MAVPKKRVTKASRGQRRSHDALNPTQLVNAKNSSSPVPQRLRRAAEMGLIKPRHGQR